MSTRDVSSEYDRWTGGGQAAPFAADSPYGGDHAVDPSRIDQGRAELDRAVQRQLAQTGSDDYSDALAIVLGQAAAGVIALSQQALQGTGITATRPGRGGIRHDARTGEVVALSSAPAAAPEAPQDSVRFADTLAWCQIVKPAATLEDRRLATGALLRRMAAR